MNKNRMCRVLNDYGTGGALSVRPSQFERINGYSNSYWGWGKEDDDLGKRFWVGEQPSRLKTERWGLLQLSEIKGVRPDEAVGRNTMLQHKHRHGEQSTLT